jgi:hypothetical protein
MPVAWFRATMANRLAWRARFAGCSRSYTHGSASWSLGRGDGCSVVGGGTDCWSVIPDPNNPDPWEMGWSGDIATLFVYIPKGGNRGRDALASFSMPFELVAVRAADNKRGGSGGGHGNGRGGGGGA